ncbi:hypothetical protein HDU93_002279 [Gonapodya sp. JEL0774]|nr:hypothetical protein HDU93_002279 [Gonapodya sp. JEL0774]
MAARSPSKEPQKLTPLLAEFLSFGCLSGFRYFETYLRGREELIIRVYNDSKTPIFSAHPHAHANSVDLAKEMGSKLVISYRTQQLMSLKTFSGLPPASPADKDLEKDSTKTAFLIAGYARYGKPFVWLRSHHSRLLQTHGQDSSDSPLTLTSTTNWPKGDVKLAEIVAELVTATLLPPPSNPFAVDHSFFDSIPLEESIVLSGAMVDFLSKLYTRRTPWSESGGSLFYYGDSKHLALFAYHVLVWNPFAVFEDLRILHRRHLSNLNEYLTKSAMSLDSSTASLF